MTPRPTPSQLSTAISRGVVTDRRRFAATMNVEMFRWWTSWDDQRLSDLHRQVCSFDQAFGEAAARRHDPRTPRELRRAANMRALECGAELAVRVNAALSVGLARRFGRFLRPVVITAADDFNDWVAYLYVTKWEDVVADLYEFQRHGRELPDLRSDLGVCDCTC